MLDNPIHTLIFGDLTLVEDGAPLVDNDDVTYIVKSQDTEWGNPAPVTVALLSLMRAGSAVAWDRTDNRNPVLRVTVRAANAELLARGEKALQLECEKPNTLTWIPPDGTGDPCVFDIVWSELEFVMDDAAEVIRTERTYLIRLQALPHAREADKVTSVAQVTATEVAVIDDGSSTTGWVVDFPAWGGSVTSTAGAIVITEASSPGGVYNQASAHRSGTVDLTVGDFIAVTWKTSIPVAALRFGIGDSANTFHLPGWPLYAASTTVSAPWTTTFFRIPDTMTSTFDMYFSVDFDPTTGQTFSIDKVAIWSALPVLGTARQKATSLIPGGSVRTTGSIQIAHATSSLGKTIVYTQPAGTGFLPPLRTWRVSGNTVTADATLVSGSREAIGTTSVVYRMPISVVPEGRVEVWAWLRAVTATGLARVAWSVSSWINSVQLSSDFFAPDIDFPATNTWYLVCLGATVSPGVQIGLNGMLQIALNENPATKGVQVDEAYLFCTDEGRLTVVDCGTASPSAGGASNRLWIDGPSLEQPQGGVWRGNAADRSDAWHAGAYALPWDVHDFDPTGTGVFVSTANTTDATTALEHYRRYHTHVARGTGGGNPTHVTPLFPTFTDPVNTASDTITLPNQTGVLWRVNMDDYSGGSVVSVAGLSGYPNTSVLAIADDGYALDDTTVFTYTFFTGTTTAFTTFWTDTFLTAPNPATFPRTPATGTTPQSTLTGTDGSHFGRVNTNVSGWAECRGYAVVGANGIDSNVGNHAIQLDYDFSTANSTDGLAKIELGASGSWGNHLFTLTKTAAGPIALTAVWNSPTTALTMVSVGGANLANLASTGTFRVERDAGLLNVYISAVKVAQAAPNILANPDFAGVPDLVSWAVSAGGSNSDIETKYVRFRNVAAYKR